MAKSPFGLPSKTVENKAHWNHRSPDLIKDAPGLVQKALHEERRLYTIDYQYVYKVYKGTFAEAKKGLLGQFGLRVVAENHSFYTEKVGKERQSAFAAWASSDPAPVSCVAHSPDSTLAFSFYENRTPPILGMKLVTTNPDLYWHVYRWWAEHTEDQSSLPIVHALTRTTPKEPLSVIGLGTFETNFDPGNYDPKVVKQYRRLIKRGLTADKPRGRMSIIHGPPGTGKTFMLKALSREVPGSKVIFIPNTLVGELGNPELVTLFTKVRDNAKQKIILLAEDADVIFRQRDSSNEGAVSAALNLTDGMYGELLKVHIVGTTNVEMNNVDKAVARPGRLCENIYVGALQPEQATTVFRRLSGDETKPPIDKEMTLAEIYEMAHEDEDEDEDEDEE